MQISYPSFDRLVTECFPDVYRLCFLLTGEPSGAWQTAFQTFLYMGTRQEPFPDRTSEQDALFGWCIRTCRDYYYRKLRRSKSRDRLEPTVPFPVSDDLWKLLGMRFMKKAVIFFTDYLDFPPERTGSILNRTPARCAADKKEGKNGLSNQWREAVFSISFPEDSAPRLLGEIYFRFEKRNVPLENKLRGIRYWWDRAIIWIAAAIVLLFAAAAWYTARIVV